MISQSASPSAAAPSLAARSGKSKASVSAGMLGCTKNRLLVSMLDVIPGEHKILVCDSTGAEIISTCLRMHELLEHGVTLVEDLFLERQPILTSPAVYFISPSTASVRRAAQDWEGKAMYKEAHICFTGVAPDALIHEIAASPTLATKTLTLKDMRLDFSVPEPLLFHLNMSGELPKLYPPETALSGGADGILSHVGERLVSVFYTLGCGVPVVRYQGGSRLAQQVARSFLDRVARMPKDIPELRTGVATTEAPLLILVDRSFDMAVPLLHDRTYQSMLSDLLTLSDGQHGVTMYEQQYLDRSGVTKTRRCPIDEKDPYWCFYRHQFLAACLEALPKHLQELLEANPSLADGMQRTGDGEGGGKALARLGNAIRALPDFQEKQAKLSMHIDICDKIMKLYEQQRLIDVCEVEQDIAAERKPLKDCVEAVRKLLGDVSVPVPVRRRLLLLLLATANSRDFSEERRQQLIRESGLTNDAKCFAAIDLLLCRQGKLPQLVHDEPGTPASGGVRGQPSRPPLTLRPRQGGVGTSAASSIAPSSAVVAGDPYRSQAYLILAAAVGHTLPTADFPVLNPTVGEPAGLSAKTGGAAPNRRTLRLALARGQDGGGGGGDGDTPHPPTPYGGATAIGIGGRHNGLLDLGFEGQFSVDHPQKVILFVLGGVTYGEARAAYDVAKRYSREVIVGGTSMLQPEQFVAQLATLGQHPSV